MLGVSKLGNLSKLNLQPKKKAQVYDELNELRVQLGLTRTKGDMSATREIVRRVGSLLTYCLTFEKMKNSEKTIF